MKANIITTPAALELISHLKARHGDLMFYMSGGCCEGSQPMCFKKGEYLPGTMDVQKGVVEDCEFYLSEEQFLYYENSQLVLDAGEGMGGGFSLEAPLGKMFLISSRLLEEGQKQA